MIDMTDSTRFYCPHCGQDMTIVVGNTCIACQMPVTAELETARHHDAELEEMAFLVHLKEGIESRNDELLLEKWASMGPAEFLETLIETKRNGKQRER
jgi:hypothetical protein